MRLAAVQDHTLSRTLQLPRRAKELQRALRTMLRQASDAELLRTAPHDIFQLVEVLGEPPASVKEQLRTRGLLDHAYCIVGGDKNQERDRRLRHFERDDGAWFDFTITVREHAQALDLLAYDFEIRFPPGTGAPFLRIDLNLPSHDNEDRDLRMRMHPGSDDILVPAPLMNPAEVLALLIYGLRMPPARDKPQAPTAFEVDWFRATHTAHASSRSLPASSDER